MRDIENPTLNEYGDEVHPAWGLARVNRHSYGGGGAVLFNSEIKHSTTVVLTLVPASRHRDLHRDWLHGMENQQTVEFEMSEAQWGALVSSFGDGSGVPVTVRSLPGQRIIPDLPFESRLALSAEETRNAAKESLATVSAAMAAYKANRTAANLRDLERVIDQAPGSMEFAAKSLTEHVENVVTKARADIEATAQAAARATGTQAITGHVFALDAAPEGDQP